jgi:sulfide:quinone oxidoreductase
MEIKKLSDDYAVAAQIGPADVQTIVAAGYKSLICHRPDGEAPDQPPYAVIEREAIARGLTVRHQPVVSGRLGGDNVEELGRLIDELPKPVLAYCRTGTRSAQLWSLLQSE